MQPDEEQYAGKQQHGGALNSNLQAEQQSRQWQEGWRLKVERRNQRSVQQTIGEGAQGFIFKQLSQGGLGL